MLDDTIAAYRRSLEITRNKLAAGTVSAADVESARTTLANAEASRRDLERQRASYENAIAVLVGENPRTSGWKAPPGSPPCPMCPPWCPQTCCSAAPMWPMPKDRWRRPIRPSASSARRSSPPSRSRVAGQQFQHRQQPVQRGFLAVVAGGKRGRNADRLWRAHRQGAAGPRRL
jgi:hypothetical protein